jgi:ATP-dependent helicase/nuclease subunit B
VQNEISFKNLPDKIVELDSNLSEYWNKTKTFLKYFGENWEEYAESKNLISKKKYITKVLNHYTKKYKDNKPANPIIIVNITANIKSTKDFIKTLSKYDNCYYIFNGLDQGLEEVGNKHPQYLLQEMVKNIKPTKIETLGQKTNIDLILEKSMLAPEKTNQWQSNLNLKRENIFSVRCENTNEEINLIGEIIEKYNARTAIVTTDNVFAAQLESSITKKEVYTAFGNKFLREECVKYLFLILDVIKSDYQTIPLVSLLKHPKTKQRFQNMMIIDSLRKKNFSNMGDTKNLEQVKNDIKQIKLKENGNFSEILQEHIKLVEYLANIEIDHKNSDFLEEIIENASELEVANLDDYSLLLEYLITGRSYANAYQIYPTISIIPPQETRILNYDLVIFTNCNEGHYPKHIQNNPWMSRTMRKDVGLSSVEEQIGIAGYDWCRLLANGKVIITRAVKEGGKTTTPSKFLLRLETFLKCQGQELKIINYRRQEEEIENKKLVRPAPNPNLSIRPKKLYATYIEKLINNPYDIYAKYILNLYKKNWFCEKTNHLNFGNAIHEALELYTKNYKKKNGVKVLKKIGFDMSKKYFDNIPEREIFYIKFDNIAEWFVKQDEIIRNEGYIIIAEDDEQKIDINGINICAKIDRQEIGGNNIFVGDYKTGNVPTKTEFYKLEKPQLLIEAIILNKDVEKIFFWEIKGRDGKNNIIEFSDKLQDTIKECRKNLEELIEYYNKQNAYICSNYELNDKNNYESDYKHLSRIEEWGW